MLETLLPPQTYFSIREVSQLTQVKPYVIRYWETQFSALRPARRYGRPPGERGAS